MVFRMRNYRKFPECPYKIINRERGTPRSDRIAMEVKINAEH